MSILIKDMKMPEGCVVCPFAERIPPGRTRCLITCRMLSDGYHAPSAWRNECCPLVEIPPHGKLVDDDAEVIFEIDCDIEPESITETKYGWHTVHLASKLKVTFIGSVHDDCIIALEVEE